MLNSVYYHAGLHWKYNRLHRWHSLLKARFYHGMRKVPFSWMITFCQSGYCCTAEPHFMFALPIGHACNLIISIRAHVPYTHTHRHTHRVYMHRAVCRTSAVCSMIWWKTWADRSRTDQWINLGPCDIYGCLCMCRGERGAADWNGSNDWMRGRKGTGWRGCEGREGELCDVDEVVWKERRRSGGFRALARALQNCVHWVWSKYNTWIRGGNFISSVKNQTILIFILGSVGVLKLLESSACGEWDAGDRAGPASQERMLVTGGRRQTDMGCGALCPPGRTSACNLSPICSTGQEACSYLLCYPYLTKRMDTHPHFMTVDWGGGGVEWCVVRRLGMPFNPFQCARNVTKWNLLCKKGWAKSCSMQNPSRGVN